EALTEWLVEYNFERPHQTLDYLTPFEYLEITLEKQQKLLPTYSASAWDRLVQNYMLELKYNQ
ncbi:MAG: integrase core domain-containing protein, partial [Candidatus Berkelbacteria bacterium]|nr:integrase core domain-containing protein [Candidatus Berkelbacteria bacterium]